MSKRVLAMALAILAFFIFVGSPFGQTAKAVVGVDDAIIAIIIAALAAMGITFVTTGAFQSTQQYVGNLMQEYASANNTSIGNQLLGTQVGSNKLGQIVMNNRLVVYIQGFAIWLMSKFGMTSNEAYELVTAGTQINGIQTYALPISFYGNVGNYEYEFNIITSQDEVYGIFVYTAEGQAATLYLLSNGPAQVKRISMNAYGTTERTYTLSSTNVWAFSYVAYTNTDLSMQSTLKKYSYEDAMTALGHGSDLDINNIGVDIGAVTGDITLPRDDPDYNEGDGAILDVGADWGDTYPTITDGVIPGEFSEGKEGAAAIDYETEEVVQDQVEDTPSQQVSQNVDEYRSLGLPDVFPFCIPFDIYAFFECLAAEPEAPSFTWRFYIPGICDEEIEIDLAAFDSAARILRTMELLLFIVGLAFVTRDKFLRG